MRGSKTGYFKGDRVVDCCLCLGIFAPDTDGMGGARWTGRWLAKSTGFQMSINRGRGASLPPVPASRSYESGDRCAADSHSSVIFAASPARCGCGRSATDRRPSTLGAETALISFVAGDRCWKVDAGELLSTGDITCCDCDCDSRLCSPSACFPSVGPCAVSSSAFASPFFGFDLAMRPRFRRSRVNWQLISPRRHLEQGKARSHRTRRVWQESQATLFRRQRRLPFASSTSTSSESGPGDG